MRRITTRLILSFLIVSVLPLAVISFTGLRAMNRVGSLAVEESSDALRELGEASIRQKAQDVARQVDLYLQVHPELLNASAAELEQDSQLFNIAVQRVGETGYSAVYDSTGITHFHVDPNIAGTDMHRLAESRPEFWAIFEASLDGSVSEGYYDWEDADGFVRQKYMSCVPVGDTDLRVAATTYIDEFYHPLRETEQKITSLFEQTQGYLILALGVVGVSSVGVALWLALGISRPVQRLIQAAEALEQGQYRSEALAAEVARRDDLGQLARVFDHAAQEIQSREAQLHRKIKELRIQIDEVKRRRQVAAITETDYFQQLREQARLMREMARSSSEE